MDFAADAVLDAVAPPTRSAPTRAAPADADEPSFDDHLEAATADEAPVQDRAPATSNEQKPQAQKGTEAEPATDGADAAPDEAQTVQGTTEPLAPQLIVQIVTPPAQQPPTQAAPTTGDAAAQAAESATSTPVAAPTTPASAADAAEEGAAETAASGAAPVDGAKAAAATKAEASAQQDQPVNAAAAATAQPTGAATDTGAQSSQASTQAQPTTTTPSNEIADAAPLLERTAAQPLSDDLRAALAATRSGKGETRGGKGVEPAPETGAPTSAPNATPITSAKSAASNTGGKDGQSIGAAAAAAIAEAPAPAPAPAAQNSANAIAQPTAQAQSSAHVDQTSAARSAPAAAQIAQEIIRRFDGDGTHFELRLDPPELGRVEVRLDVSRDHRVTAVIAADSPQALSELTRHARELEQMLQSAGLELSDSGLSFDLRQGQEGSANANQTGAAPGWGATGEDVTQQNDARARPLGYERWRGVRVDMMV